MLSCTKYRSLWYRNRAIFSGAELILLLPVILLPVTGQKWRFTGCVIILGIRLVVSGIAYRIKRRGSAKEKTNAKVISGAVMSIFLIDFALFPPPLAKMLGKGEGEAIIEPWDARVAENYRGAFSTRQVYCK